MKQEVFAELRSKRIEQLLLSKISKENKIDDGRLSDSVIDLFDNGNIDSIYEYESTINELMATCLHPDVQKHIPDWLKPEIGKRLLNLSGFFRSLDYENFYLYLAYIKIKNYGYAMSDDELDSFEQYFLK